MFQKTKVICGLFLFLTGIFLANSVSADVVTLTGAELDTHSNSTFVGTRARTVNGNALDFDAAASDDEGLFFYNLFPAGTFGAGSPMNRVTVVMNITRVEDDHDVFMGLWDGINFLATTSFDGERSSRFDTSTFDGTNFTFDGFLDQSFYSTPFAIGESFNIGAIFDLSAGSPEFITVLPDGTQMAPITSSTFDWTSDISIVFGLNSAIERTSINSLTIATVPEPSSLMITGLAAGLIGMRRRQRIELRLN